MKYSGFKKKEVISSSDGRSLGFVTDFIFDPCTGQIQSLVLSGNGGFLSSIFSDKQCCISWCEICKIGCDVILVRLEPNMPKNR